MKEYQAILKELASKKYHPVYFLSGEEPWYIDKVADYISQNILNDNEKEFNQTIVYGKDTEADTILSMARRYPMMSPYQVIIVREAQQIRKIEVLQDYIKNPIKTTILVICYKYKKLDKRTKFYKLLSGNSRFFESPKMYANKVPEWINERAKDLQINLNRNAVMLLAEYLGDDLHKLENGLEKLRIRKGNGEEINLGDIEENIGISRDFNVFELQKAIGQRDHKRIAMIVDYMQDNPKQNPFPQIIGALFNYFSKIIVLQYSKENSRDAARKANIHEYFLKDYLQAAGNYKGKMQKIIELLHEYDLRSKGINDAGTEQGELLREMTVRILSA